MTQRDVWQRGRFPSSHHFWLPGPRAGPRDSHGHLSGPRPGHGAFTVANKVPNLIRTLLADTAISAAFIPVFSSLLEKKRVREAWQVALHRDGSWPPSSSGHYPRWV